MLNAKTRDRGIRMTEIDSEEVRLVAAGKAGDRDAFSKLVMPHANRLFRAAHRITRNREDAEDAVQDCIVNAFVRLASFTGASRFSTWLTRIAINAALMRLRKRRLLREVAMEEPGDEAWTPTLYETVDLLPNPEESCARAERDSIVREAVAKLRPTLRQTMEIHGLKENSLQETAHLLRVSTGAVKARMFHARTALRREPMLRALLEQNSAVIGSPGLTGQRRSAGSPHC